MTTSSRECRHCLPRGVAAGWDGASGLRGGEGGGEAPSATGKARGKDLALGAKVMRVHLYSSLSPTTSGIARHGKPVKREGGGGACLLKEGLACGCA